MKWKISDVKIDNQIALAPMAGICDFAFRTIIKSMGCGLIETEMISNNALMYANEKTREMLYATDYERPFSIQIFGSDIESFEIASKYVYENASPDIIDINMGCPVAKVALRSHAGSALLKNPKKAYDIVKCVVESVPIPVTVKIRSGWDETCINAVEISKLAEDAGASAVTIHPRTRTQKYDVESDWNLIKIIKENVSIPVIGNGDIRSCYDAEEMIAMTNCDGVMIGRGVLGNPWLVKECIDYLKDGSKPEKITLEEKIAMIKKHAELLCQIKNEKIAMHKMRTHAAYYLKGVHRGFDIKPKIFKTNTKEELFNLLDDWMSEYRKHQF